MTNLATWLHQVLYSFVSTLYKYYHKKQLWLFIGQVSSDYCDEVKYHFHLIPLSNHFE